MYNLNYEETLVYLKTFTLPTDSDSVKQSRHSLLWSVTTDIESFYTNALKFTVSRSMLTQLEDFYHRNVDKETLQLDLEARKWIVIENSIYESPTKIPEEVAGKG